MGESLSELFSGDRSPRLFERFKSGEVIPRSQLEISKFFTDCIVVVITSVKTGYNF